MTREVLVRAHLNAFLDQLRLDSILQGATYADKVTGSPELYCVVNLNNGDRFGDRSTGADESAIFRAGVRSVGRTRDQAQLIAEHVFAQAMNVRLVVPGRILTRIKHGGGQPTQEDDSVNPPLWFASDIFTFRSDPA